MILLSSMHCEMADCVGDRVLRLQSSGNSLLGLIVVRLGVGLIGGGNGNMIEWMNQWTNFLFDY